LSALQEEAFAASTITLLEAIEALYLLMMLIHVFLDNARFVTPSWCSNGWRGPVAV
jgi:hypothetical protein